MSIIPALIAAVIITVGSKAPLALAQAKTGHYDNKNPRAQQAKLEGWGARAAAAHANGWEALPIFLAGGALSSPQEPPKPCFWGPAGTEGNELVQKTEGLCVTFVGFV